MSDRTWRLVLALGMVPPSMLAVVAILASGGQAALPLMILTGVLLTFSAVCLFLVERDASPSPPAEGHTSGSASIGDEQPRARSTPSDRRSVVLDLGVRWEPDSPDPWLIQRDGAAALVVQPHPDDDDRRLVVLVWSPCIAARIGPALRATSLDSRAPDEPSERDAVTEVCESAWVARLAVAEKAAYGDAGQLGLRHFVVRTNESTVEVVAANVVVQRVQTIRLTAEDRSGSPTRRVGGPGEG